MEQDDDVAIDYQELRTKRSSVRSSASVSEPSVLQQIRERGSLKHLKKYLRTRAAGHENPTSDTATDTNIVDHGLTRCKSDDNAPSFRLAIFLSINSISFIAFCDCGRIKSSE